MRQDSRGTEQSAQAGGARICEGLVWAERPGWASGAAASHWWDSHVTEQMMVPGPAWLWRVDVGAGDCMSFSLHLGGGAQP